MNVPTVIKKPKVLIVDDDNDLLEMLVDIFTSGGLKVVTAVDGVDASFKYNNEEFDAIITDIKMPKKDGIKFVQHIQLIETQKMMKQGSSYKALPVFLISASIDDYHAELELISNVDVISKPFSPKDVLQKVKNALENSRSQAPQSVSLRFSSGDFVMKEGDSGTDIFFVKSGKLQVSKKGLNDAEVILCTVGVGEIVGEMGFLLHKNRSASVKAILDSELISIPKDKFDSIITAQPKWFRVLFETIASRLEDTTKDLVNEKSKG